MKRKARVVTEKRWEEQAKSDGAITRIYDADRGWSWRKGHSNWVGHNEVVLRVRVTLTYEVPDAR